jgi:ribonuclease T1
VSRTSRPVRPGPGQRAVRSLLLAVLLVAAALWLQRPASTSADRSQPGPATTAAAEDDWPAFLPAEARPVLVRIASGAAHPYPQDGSVFHNREGRLPAQPRGHYREYTVETPGLGHRGARRIVTGGQPPATYHYTDDHYGSFRRFEPPRDLVP